MKRYAHVRWGKEQKSGCNMVQQHDASRRRRRRRRLELLPYYHCHIPEQQRVSQFCFWDLIQYFPLRCVLSRVAPVNVRRCRYY